MFINTFLIAFSPFQRTAYKLITSYSTLYPNLTPRKRFSRAIEKTIYVVADHRCQICGRYIEFDDGVLDHIIPLGNGGPDESTNLQWTCYRCNQLKSNKLSEEQVRQILRLPDNFHDALILQQIKEKSTYKGSPQYSEQLIELSQDNLDSGLIRKYKKTFKETYQRSTIIPEAFPTVPHSKPDHTFVNIGFSHRYPIEWFQSNQDPLHFSDPVFNMAGREIAYAEQQYLDSQLDKFSISGVNSFSYKTLEKNIEFMYDKQVGPNLFWPTLDIYTQIHSMKNVKVEYPPSTANSLMKSKLIIGDRELRIIPPLGSVPNKPVIMNSKSIKWHIRSYKTTGAVFCQLGNDRLYPDKYVEFIVYTSVFLSIDQDGVHVFS